jgi:hypothetical protein
MSKEQLMIEKNKIEMKLKKYENKLKKLEKEMKCYNLLSIENDIIELPMPLYYNTLTDRNLQREKSKKNTKNLLNKLNMRKKSNEQIKIKKEVTEEIEIPPLEYDDIPPLEYAY